MTALAWQDLADLVVRDPDAILDERDRRRLAAFTRRLSPDYLGGTHIDALIAALTWAATTPNARLIVTMPPRHSKSLHVSIMLPAWYLGRSPDRRIIGAAHTALLAFRWSRRVRNTITHPRYPFPGLQIAGDAAAVEAWDLAGHRGGYIAVGVKGAPAGSGADLLVIDDPVRNAADADSALFRDALWEWYREDIRTRLEPGGSIVLTSTRWHADDLTGRLLAAQEAGGEPWRHLHLPAILADGTALWPERWPLAALEATRDAIGLRAFTSLYQGAPSIASGAVLKRHWWRYWTIPGITPDPVIAEDEQGQRVPCVQRPRPGAFDDACQSWDMSFKKTDTGSYVVGQVWWRVGADRYLVDQFRHRVDFPDAVLAVRALSAAHPTVAAKLVENKANGPAIVAQLRSHIAGLVEVEPEGGKETRANAAAAVVASGNVYLPHPSIAPWVEAFVDEASGFPHGAHDDQVDAFSQAMHHFGLGLAMIGASYLTVANGDDRPAVDAVGNELAPWRHPVWGQTNGARRWP